MEAIIAIWLEASIKAHDFMSQEYWESKVADMQNIYIPASETYVHDNYGTIEGFISICDDTVAAIFVRPTSQGKGIGSELIEFAKSNYGVLNLCVYKNNTKSVNFYKRHGFREVCEQFDEHTGGSELKMKYNR